MMTSIVIIIIIN